MKIFSQKIKSGIIIIFFILIILFTSKKKIGVICLNHGYNIGNSLLQYAMSIKLKELGLIPYMIGTNNQNKKKPFLKKYTNCVVIKNNFSEIKKNEYDLLMVNSDQTWRKFSIHFHDIAFLKFAQNWKIPKFVYGASLGYSDWRLSEEDDKMGKNLLRQFSGISVREKGSVGLVEAHFGIKPIFVLDPTLLIDKRYYLKIIKNFKINNSKIPYIFIYILRKENNIKKYIRYASEQLKYRIVKVELEEIYSVEKFIYGIYNCKAVITNSYHGTLFSIIFNKPFVSFIAKNSAKERFISLKDTLKIKNRIFEYNEFPNINLLTKPFYLNQTLLNLLKNKSIKKKYRNKLKKVNYYYFIFIKNEIFYNCLK